MNMINFQIQIFLLALTGFVLGKRKVLDARTRGHLTDLILMAALPFPSSILFRWRCRRRS